MMLESDFARWKRCSLRLYRDPPAHHMWQPHPKETRPLWSSPWVAQETGIRHPGSFSLKLKASEVHSPPMPRP